MAASARCSTVLDAPKNVENGSKNPRARKVIAAEKLERNISAGIVGNYTEKVLHQSVIPVGKPRLRRHRCLQGYRFRSRDSKDPNLPAGPCAWPTERPHIELGARHLVDLIRLGPNAVCAGAPLVVGEGRSSMVLVNPGLPIVQPNQFSPLGGLLPIHQQESPLKRKFLGEEWNLLALSERLAA